VKDLGNRIAKNLRHLKKWAKREGVTCYRVYDRDIPDIPLAIDWYEGHVVLHDFRNSHRDRGEALATAWLDEQLADTREALGIEEIFVKRRERMVGRHETGRQYERLAERGAWFTVGEGGHRFQVNLSDYTDTGLFLDHRVTRARVGAEARGKRVLNLFCYTASFTVYAAKAGATSSLSIDLSNTYLDWARENLALNHVDPRKHVLQQGDVKDELAGLRDRFDLAIVDPPTWSVSKRMDGTFDVQRDHPALLVAVARVMAPGGVIWFSTNLRTFEFAPPARLAPTWTITDESHATIPPDFRDRRIHQAFRIQLPVVGSDR
jgi:23S rRNA G2069 N7-methylase RlmK/C1962 C5-methylase RlmI